MSGLLDGGIRPVPGRDVLGWAFPGLMLPPLMVGPRDLGRRGRRHVGDRGEQRDELTLSLAVAGRELVFDDPDAAGLVLV